MNKRYKIYRMRIERGLTMLDVANGIGVSKSLISRIEKGERNITETVYNDLMAYLNSVPIDERFMEGE